MANVNFSNVQVVSTFASPHSQNAWGLVSGGWHKIQPISVDGVTNFFVVLNAAKASGRTVSGSYDSATGQLNIIYLN